MRFLLFILTALSLLVLSCKKEPEKVVAQTPVSSCVCLKENLGGSPINQTTCNGFLSLSKYITESKDRPTTDYVNATAFFSNIASTSVNGNFTMVDSVLLNGHLLPKIKDVNGDPVYYELDYSTMPIEQKWSIFNVQGIPTFTSNPDLKDPSANFSLIPTNISKSLMRSFKINEVKNITRGTAIILDYSGKSNYNISVILREGSNEVCFPENDLKLLGPGKAILVFILENTKIQTFDSKNFMFSKKLQFEKEITLVQ